MEIWQEYYTQSGVCDLSCLHPRAKWMGHFFWKYCKKHFITNGICQYFEMWIAKLIYNIILKWVSKWIVLLVERWNNYHNFFFDFINPYCSICDSLKTYPHFFKNLKSFRQSSPSYTMLEREPLPRSFSMNIGRSRFIKPFFNYKLFELLMKTNEFLNHHGGIVYQSMNGQQNKIEKKPSNEPT